MDSNHPAPRSVHLASAGGHVFSAEPEQSRHTFIRKRIVKFFLQGFHIRQTRTAHLSMHPSDEQDNSCRIKTESFPEKRPTDFPGFPTFDGSVMREPEIERHVAGEAVHEVESAEPSDAHGVGAVARHLQVPQPGCRVLHVHDERLADLEQLVQPVRLGQRHPCGTIRDPACVLFSTAQNFDESHQVATTKRPHQASSA